jgi:LacI family transcriptional regulator
MQSSAPAHNRKHVAVCVDSSGSHGRGVLRGIAEYVSTYRSWSVVLDAHTHATGRSPHGWLRKWRGDGILIYTQNPSLPRRLSRCGIPAVELYNHPLDVGLPQVGNDNEKIGRLAAEHLIERRLKHFAFCGYAGELWCQRRQDGFIATACEAGTVHESFLGPHFPASLAESERTRRRLSQWVCSLPKPVGIMACSDRHAQRLLDACREAGAAVPEEVAVIGVNNDEEICLLAHPPLTSVQDNLRQVGYQAAALLDQLMGGRLRANEVEPILVPPLGVAARRSTDVTATTDRLIAGAARRIYERACQGLTVKQLLQELSVSRNAFYRRFQTVLGRSPHEQILHVRFEHVKNLLVQTDLSLEKIAELTGFEYPEYLNVAFKRKFGIPPGAFRRQQRQGK